MIIIHVYNLGTGWAEIITKKLIINEANKNK